MTPSYHVGLIRPLYDIGIVVCYIALLFRCPVVCENHIYCAARGDQPHGSRSTSGSLAGSIPVDALAGVIAEAVRETLSSDQHRGLQLRTKYEIAVGHSSSSRGSDSGAGAVRRRCARASIFAFNRSRRNTSRKLRPTPAKFFAFHPTAKGETALLFFLVDREEVH